MINYQNVVTASAGSTRQKGIDSRETESSTKACQSFRIHPKLSYTSAEAAEALGISVRSLRRLEIRGLIRCSKALGKKLYPLTEIQRFLEETL